MYIRRYTEIPILLTSGISKKKTRITLRTSQIATLACFVNNSIWMRHPHQATCCTNEWGLVISMYEKLHQF